MVTVSRGNVGRLLTRPYLEHPGYPLKHSVDHFPIYPVELMRKYYIALVEARPGQLLVYSESESISLVRRNLVGAKHDTQGFQGEAPSPVLECERVFIDSSFGVVIHLTV